MQSLFKHYLITRYNVPLEGWEKDKQGRSTRDAAWLEHRFILYTTFCFPSVIAQRNKEFTWLIYMDKDTPSSYLQQVKHHVVAFPFIEIRLATGYVDCLEDIKIVLQQSQSQYVITSRLDNDDALGSDYIETVQSHFKPMHGLLINLLHGHGYDMRQQVGMRLSHIRQNSFMSLIEHCSPDVPLISIRGFQHDNPPQHFKAINIPAAHSWLKIFHDRNLKSEAFGMPVWSNHFSNQYGVNRKDLPIQTKHTTQYLFWWLRDGIARKLGIQRKRSSKV